MAEAINDNQEENGEMSWDEFQECALNFLKISNELLDEWEYIKKDDNPGNSYLKKKCIVNLRKQGVAEDDQNTAEENLLNINDPSVKLFENQDNIYSFEYHILYSLAYSVPMLYFNARKSNGTLIKLEDAWNIFDQRYKTNIDMLSTLTQMEHPILFQPFLTLHPCRTKEFLGIMSKR